MPAYRRNITQRVQFGRTGAPEKSQIKEHGKDG